MKFKSKWELYTQWTCVLSDNKEMTFLPWNLLTKWLQHVNIFQAAIDNGWNWIVIGYYLSAQCYWNNLLVIWHTSKHYVFVYQCVYFSNCVLYSISDCKQTTQNPFFINTSVNSHYPVISAASFAYDTVRYPVWNCVTIGQKRVSRTQIESVSFAVGSINQPDTFHLQNAI